MNILPFQPASPPVSDETALADAVLALARSELSRRLAAGEDNHCDEEQYHLPRWAQMQDSGNSLGVLIEAVGYLDSSRVSCCPSNPAHAHNKSPAFDRAQALLLRIGGTRGGVFHAAVRARIAKLPGFSARELITSDFAPVHSCYVTYTWMDVGDYSVCVKEGGRFGRYAVVSRAEAEQYLARRAAPRRMAALNAQRPA